MPITLTKLTEAEQQAVDNYERDISDLRARKAIEKAEADARLQNTLDAINNPKPTEKKEKEIISETYHELTGGKKIKLTSYADGSEKTTALADDFNLPGQLRQRSKLSDAAKAAYIRENGLYSRKNANVAAFMELPQ